MANGFNTGGNPLLRYSERKLQSTKNLENNLALQKQRYQYGLELGREQAQLMNAQKMIAREMDMATTFLTSKSLSHRKMGIEMLEKVTGKTYPALRDNNDMALQALQEVRRFVTDPKIGDEIGLKAWQQFEQEYGMSAESAAGKVPFEETKRLETIEATEAAKTRGREGEKKPGPPKPKSKNEIVAAAAGVDITKSLTQEDANKFLSKWNELFGAESLLQLLLGGQVEGIAPLDTGGAEGMTEAEKRELEALRSEVGQ